MSSPDARLAAALVCEDYLPNLNVRSTFTFWCGSYAADENYSSWVSNSATNNSHACNFWQFRLHWFDELRKSTLHPLAASPESWLHPKTCENVFILSCSESIIPCGTLSKAFWLASHHPDTYLDRVRDVVQLLNPRTLTLAHPTPPNCKSRAVKTLT